MIKVGAEVGSGVAGALAKEVPVVVVTVKAVADTVETVVCRLTVLMSQIPPGTSQQTSGNDLAPRDRTLHNSAPVLDEVVALAVATTTVTVKCNVMRVQLTLPVTVIPSLPLTVNSTRISRSAVLRMAVVSDAVRITADSRMVLVATER